MRITAREGSSEEVTGEENILKGKAGAELDMECVSEGGNPAPALSWFVGNKLIATKMSQENFKTSSGSWKAVSRLSLPISRADNKAEVRCEVTHAALETEMVATKTLDILYPPRVAASSTAEGRALAEGETVEFTCSADSNPPAKLSWRRSGGNLLTTESSFIIQAVGRSSAGGYECVAVNQLGRSKPAIVDIHVQCKYSL